MSGGDRRTGRGDREDALYAGKRAEQTRRRAAHDRRRFDPAPPTDEDWTVAGEEDEAVNRLARPTPVGETLHHLVQRRGWTERLHGAEAWSRWPEIVGPDLAARCEPVRLAGGTLVVRAESQVWATQLRYLGAEVRRNTASVLGAGVVRDIRVVVGPLDGGDGTA